MAWPFDNKPAISGFGSVDSVLPIDYGTQQLAKYANQNWFPNEVDETVTGVEYPGGNPVYPGNPGLYRDRIMNMPAASTNKYIQRKEDTEPGFLRKTGNTIKDFASNLNPLGIINTLTGRKGADQSFGGYPGGQFSRAGLFPQEVSNLQSLADQGLLRSGGKDAFGTNVVSQFGDYDKAMAKNLGVFKDTMGKKGIDNLDDLEKYYLERYGDKSYIYNKLRHVRGWDQTGTRTAADQITTGAPDFITRDGATPSGPVTTGGGGTFNPAFDQRGRRDPGPEPYGAPTWHGATEARGQTFQDTNRQSGQVAGPGFGRGAYWAEGGRVGYQDGELVEDEYMAEATPAGMMEENIEEVQGEPTREQLEAIALEIFRLPLEELNEEQLNVVYQAAMEQEPAEEEVQFAAQEGPGEGIASLV